MSKNKQFDTSLLDILVCPISNERLIFDKETMTLVAKKSKLAYPVIDGVPIMLASEVIKL